MFLSPKICKHFLILFYSSLNGTRHSSFRYFSEYSSHESSKYMQKLLYKRAAKSKQKWYQSHVAEPMELVGRLHKPNKQGRTPAQSVKSIQLSHVLYDRITQLINTGELSEEILNKQVLVTAVKVHLNSASVNVHWDSDRSDASEVDELLQSHAKKLRNLLISYHVLGRIPPITFVKDYSKHFNTQLNQLLEVADYGPDYIPSSQENSAVTSNRFSKSTRWSSTEEVLSTHLSKMKWNNSFSNSQSASSSVDSEKCHDDKVRSNDVNASSSHEEQVPSNSQNSHLIEGLDFRSNLYGLPHDELMKKVIVQRTKTTFGNGNTQLNTVAQSADFDMLRLNKNKMKLQSLKDSTKMKQKLLERDIEDF